MQLINKGPVLVLYRPLIPPNTGNIARLTIATNSRLIIVGKTGFELSHKAARRAGMDYWSNVNLTIYKDFKSFYLAEIESKNKRMIAITKEGKNSIFDFQFSKDDFLIFGNESSGIPPKLLKLCNESLRIPMWQNSRSLNLSNAAAITSYFYMYRLFDESILNQETPAFRTYFKKN